MTPRAKAGADEPEEARSAAEYLPAQKDLKHLKEAAENCQGCDLYKNASQTVFGEGNPHARIMFIGEIPGDREDLEGRPFVGPAGKLLAKALKEVGIEPADVYVTNAVKHFSFQWVGRRRLHQTPRAREIAACLPWLQAEIRAVKPDVIVCLGATASKVLLGKAFRITTGRGQFIASQWDAEIMATIHPSAILRSADDDTRHEQMAQFLEDLRRIATYLQRHRPG